MRPVRLLLALAVSAVALLAWAQAARAYAPGSGTLWTESFEDGNDDGWRAQGTLSKWSVVDRAGTKSYLADGREDIFRGLPETSVRPFVAVPVGSFDLCFQLTSVMFSGWSFACELRPPRDDQPFYRLTVAEDGHAEVQLDGPGGPAVVASTPPDVVRPSTATWMRLRFRPGAGGTTDVALRAWTGGAAAEPAPWTATGSTAAADGVPYLQRAILTAGQSSGAGQTWVDEIDAFGDTSAGVLSTIKTVWILEASHLDIGFTAPPSAIEAFAKTHLDQVLANLRSTPDYRWTIESSWQLLRWMERSTPAEIGELMGFARAGRLSLGAGYANLHTTVTSREELYRALSFSLGVGRAEGFPVRTWIQDDVPGATWALPELLAKSGVSYYLGGMNCSFGGVVSAPSHATRPFWWEGPDGSRVLSWITFDSYAEGLGDYGLSFFDDLARLHQGLGAGLGAQEGLGYPHENLLVMRAFDNHYQGLFVRNLVRQWNATYSTPVLRLATPEEFFAALTSEIQAKAWDIPVVRGDFGGAWTSVIPGTAHAQAWIQDARRDLHAAEAFAAIAAAAGEPYPAPAVDLAWRRVVEMDEHSGGGLPWPGLLTEAEAVAAATEHQAFASEARDVSRATLDSSLAALNARLDLPSGGFVVWNGLDQSRSGLVSAALPPGLLPGTFRLIDASRGEEIPYQVDPDAPGTIAFIGHLVPGTGWACYETLPGAPLAFPDAATMTPVSLEAGGLRVTLDPADGSLASLLDLGSGRELIDAASPYRGGQSAWNDGMRAFWAVAPTADVPTAARVRVGSLGPVFGSLVVERDGTPAARMVVRLTGELGRVELLSTFDRSRVPPVPAAEGSRTYALTFPFALRDFDFATESPARLLRPVTDGFARTSTFAQVNTLACLDVEDAAGAVVLASPDTVVSEWGGISQGVPAHRTSQATWFVRVKSVADEAEFEGGAVGPMDDEPGTSPIFPATIVIAPRGAASEADVRNIGQDLVEPLHATWVAGATGTWPRGGRAIVGTGATGPGGGSGAMFTLTRTADGALLGRVEEREGAATDALVGTILDVTSATLATPQGDPGAPLAPAGDRWSLPQAPYGTTSFRLQARDACTPVLLRVSRDDRLGRVVLDWTGGVRPWRILGSLDPRFSRDTRVIDAASLAPTTRDAVLGDGALWFYDVR